MIHMDGDNQERELVAMLEEDGWPAIRFAASGGGTDRPLPDILIRADNSLVAGEMKSTNSDHAYIDSEKLDDLYEFCEKWKAIPVAISRWSQDTDFYVLPLYDDDVDRHLTRSENLSLKRDLRDDYYELYRYLEILERATS